MKARVLVAHGNALMGDALREALEREGCRVTTTCDGHSALGRVLSEGQDLIVIDRDLPGLSGERVVEALRAQGSQTPVLFTCSEPSWKSTAPGVLGTLPVPFEEESLIAATEAALSGDLRRLEEAVVATEPATQPFVPGSPSLRRKHALRAQPGAALPARTSGPAQAEPVSRRRILLIDADAEALERHRKALAASGYEVTAICRGDEGFERGITEAFDMVVTDLWLPGLDGFDMIAGLQRGGATAPVVVATAYLRKDMVTELRGLGVRRVLIKPFPEAALVRCALSTVRP